jgi:DNA-binding NarL/FixJ family response regulator
MSETTTVVIADDHAVVRSGLRLLLDAEPGLEVVAEAGDVPTALRMAKAHRPRVLVLDLNMPGGSSLDAIAELREHAAETAVVVLTMQDDPAFAREALRNGRRPTTSCSRPSTSRPRATPTSTPGSARASPPSRPSPTARPTTSPSARSTSCA